MIILDFIFEPVVAQVKGTFAKESAKIETLTTTSQFSSTRLIFVIVTSSFNPFFNLNVIVSVEVETVTPSQFNGGANLQLSEINNWGFPIKNHNEAITTNKTIIAQP